MIDPLPKSFQKRRLPGTFSEADDYNVRTLVSQQFVVVCRAPNELLQLDFDVHTSWQVQLHQGVNGLVGWIDDVDQSNMRTDLELVT